MSQSPAAPAAPVAPAAETQPPARESSGALRYLPLLLVILPAALFSAVVVTRALKTRDAAPLLLVMGEVPAFELTERNGQPVTRDNLIGRIWVANFIFTRCPGPCPKMCSQLADLQNTLKHKAQDIRIVSFTLDPEHDTPEVLDRYAKLFNADTERWLFVRGEKAAVQRLASEGFKLASVEKVPGEIVHSTRFVLVDPQGRIRGYYDSQEPEGLPKLRKELDLLIKESTR